MPGKKLFGKKLAGKKVVRKKATREKVVRKRLPGNKLFGKKLPGKKVARSKLSGKHVRKSCPETNCTEMKSSAPEKYLPNDRPTLSESLILNVWVTWGTLYPHPGEGDYAGNAFPSLVRGNESVPAQSMKRFKKTAPPKFTYIRKNVSKFVVRRKGYKECPRLRSSRTCAKTSENWQQNKKEHQFCPH